MSTSSIHRSDTAAPPDTSFADRLCDRFDRALGLDTPGAKTITLSGASRADFDAMEQKVRQFERTAPSIGQAELERLARGAIVQKILPRSDGLAAQITRGVVDCSLEDYLAKIPLAAWGRHIADHKGGEVKRAGSRDQIERMVLRSPGKDLDMTKLERLEERRTVAGKLRDATVRWDVVKSDNGTVLDDVGLLRFEPFPGDATRTLVTWHNAVRYDKLSLDLLPGAIGKKVLERTLLDYFARTIAVQRRDAGA